LKKKQLGPPSRIVDPWRAGVVRAHQLQLGQKISSNIVGQRAIYRDLMNAVVAREAPASTSQSGMGERGPSEAGSWDTTLRSQLDELTASRLRMNIMKKKLTDFLKVPAEFRSAAVGIKMLEDLKELSQKLRELSLPIDLREIGKAVSNRLEFPGDTVDGLFEEC
jgi:hypothetical protein